MRTSVRTQNLQLDQITHRLERTIFVRLKLLGFNNVEFDLKNEYLSGQQFQGPKQKPIYFLKVPFQDTFVYASVIGRQQLFMPLFFNSYVGTPDYTKEILALDKLEIIPRTRLTNYNKRLDQVFEKIKEVTHGTTNNI